MITLLTVIFLAIFSYQIIYIFDIDKLVKIIGDKLKVCKGVKI